MAIGDPGIPPATPAMAPWTIPEMAWANSGGNPDAPEMPVALTDTFGVSGNGTPDGFALEFPVELVDSFVSG